jgi:hypothetical protein
MEQRISNRLRNSGSPEARQFNAKCLVPAPMPISMT